MEWPCGLLKPRERCQRLSAEQAIALARDPRLKDDPMIRSEIQICQHSDHPSLHEDLRRRFHWGVLQSVLHPDPFLPNYPSRGQLRAPRLGDAPILRIPNGLIFPVPMGRIGSSQNIGVVGRTGGGKSTWLKVMLLAWSGLGTILAFENKHDLAQIANYDQFGEVLLLDAAKDIHLSLSDGLEFMNIHEHIAQISGLFTNALNLRANGRLLGPLCHEAHQRYGPQGLRLSVLLSIAEQIGRGTARTSVLGGYCQSLIVALRDLLNRTGALFDSSQSDFLKRLFSKPRTVILNWGHLAREHANLMGGMLYRYIFESRLATGIYSPPIVFAFDDALEFITGTRTREAEGHINPIASYSKLGRQLDIGVVWTNQTYSLSSPVLRQNTDTLIAVGGNYGDDASALARFMALSPEQAEMLPRIRPGTGITIVRSFWPYAVMGAVPMLV